MSTVIRMDEEIVSYRNEMLISRMQIKAEDLKKTIRARAINHQYSSKIQRRLANKKSRVNETIESLKFHDEEPKIQLS